MPETANFGARTGTILWRKQGLLAPITRIARVRRSRYQGLWESKESLPGPTTSCTRPASRIWDEVVVLHGRLQPRPCEGHGSGPRQSGQRRADVVRGARPRTFSPASSRNTNGRAMHATMRPMGSTTQYSKRPATRSAAVDSDRWFFTSDQTFIHTANGRPQSRAAGRPSQRPSRLETGLVKPGWSEPEAEGDDDDGRSAHYRRSSPIAP